jgi:hypothetical protein
LIFSASVLGAGALEQQGGAAGDGERFAVRDDVLVVQTGEHFALGDQAVVVRDVAGHLEDVLFFAAVPAHQQASLDEPRPTRLTTVKPPSSRSPVLAMLGSTVASGSGVVSSSSTRSRSSRKPWIVS